MKCLKTDSERKSFVITCLLFTVLLIILLYFKITFSIAENELEGGGGEIGINFGDQDFGFGKNNQSTDLSKTGTSKTIPVHKVSENADFIKQESDDAPVINTNSRSTHSKKTDTDPIKKEEPKPSKSTSDVLSNILNHAKNKEGDGLDKTAGNKGSLNGSYNSTSYNSGGGTESGGDGGSGTGSGYGSGNGNGMGNYQLAGRSALSTPQPKYICNEEGIVVMEIAVDRSGKVISAEPGRGSTNLAKCLVDQARNASMNTRWQPNDNAPEKQIGKIIYNFKLTEK